MRLRRRIWKHYRRQFIRIKIRREPENRSTAVMLTRWRKLREWQKSRLYFILCGSSMSFMEYQVLGYESPLYGRRTAQLKIQALNYREITAFHPELEAADQALLYGVTGGIPHYINKLEVEDNLDDAILENLFNTSSYLFEEPENLLKQELREPAVYNSVIAAIAGGASRVNEISTKAGLESGTCIKYLKVLLDLGIVKKETPVTEKQGEVVLLTLEDIYGKRQHTEK